jgi:predicted lipoprotein
MGGSDNGAPAAPLARQAVPGRSRPAWVNPALAAAAAGAFLFFFPLFHVVSLQPRGATAAATATGPAAPAVFDPVAAAAKFWQVDLPAAHARAADLAQVAPATRASAEKARSQFAKAAGLGTAYFFVRGSGKVVAREKNVLRLAPVGAETEFVVIRLGPVFGNTVRDGTGLLDVNNFPGLQEFNALSAELNALVEKSVLPALRDRAIVGATVHFVGCAEAPESAPDAGEPLFTLVPVQAEVR